MERVITTCPFCACGCAVYLHTRDGRPAGVAPSEHHPVSRGKLCARGWNAHEAPTWGERLTQPMVRRGGVLEPTTWNDALETARGGLAALARRGRGVGVLGSARATNEENYLAARLARGALGSAHLDSCLRATYQPVVDGIASVLGTAPNGTLADIEASEAILVLESDLAATHPQAVHALIRALKAGAKLITVGSARTQLARLATLHLATRPGERLGVVASLVAALLREKEPAQVPGIDELAGSLAALSVTDLAQRAAGWLAGAARVSVLIAPEGGGPERAMRAASAVATLAAIAGRSGQGGARLVVLPARGNLRGACEMGVTPEKLPGGTGLDDTTLVERLARAWGRSPSQVAGLAADAMIAEVGGFVVVADDPPAVLPGGRRALDAMSASDCLVVLDAFATPTARAAHVVLPIASFAEGEGTVTNMEGRVQRVRPAAQPPGEARAGWKVLAELSEVLGLPLPYRSVADVLREIALVVPTYAGVSERVMDEAWGTFTSRPTDGRGITVRSLGTGRAVVAAPAVLGLDGVYDWGSDPLVSFSPTLCRDHVSQRKLYPRGLVQMSKADADGIGVRHGWPVRLISAHGETVLPVVLRDELEPGVMLVPYALREVVAGVLGGGNEVAVKAEKVQ